MTNIQRKFQIGFIGSIALAATLLAPATLATTLPHDCDSNAVVWCGADTKNQLLTKIQNGDDHNSAANLQAIYYNEGRGITAAGITSSVDGVVFKDGHVTVDGKTVATNAMSTGRNQTPNSVRVGSLWQRPTSEAFLANSIQAFVNMDGGTFHWAIQMSVWGRLSALKSVGKILSGLFSQAR